MDSSLTYRDVVEVLTLLKESRHCRSLDLEIGDFKFSMTAAADEVANARRGAGGASVPAATDAAAVTDAAVSPAKPAVAAAGAQPAAAASARAGAAVPPGDCGELILAPMLGVFYRAPEPGAAPYVDVGDEVDSEQTVGLIEVMKLFSSVRAGVRGRIVEILVENGQMVEYNQPIYRIELK